MRIDKDLFWYEKRVAELEALRLKDTERLKTLGEKVLALEQQNLALAAAIEEKNAALISLEEAIAAINDSKMVEGLILCDAEPIGEIEVIDVDEDAQPSAWIRINTDVELGDQLYAPRRTEK